MSGKVAIVRTSNVTSSRDPTDGISPRGIITADCQILAVFPDVTNTGPLSCRTETLNKTNIASGATRCVSHKSEAATHIQVAGIEKRGASAEPQSLPVTGARKLDPSHADFQPVIHGMCTQASGLRLSAESVLMPRL